MWEHSLYGLALIVTLCCLWLIDRSYKLVFYQQPKAAIATLVLGVLFFAGWDLAGIRSQIFYTGSHRFLSGLFVTGDFPMEELLFLTVLCYMPLLLTELFKRRKRD